MTKNVKLPGIPGKNMRNYYFNDWISSESVQKLADFFNNGRGTVYFESTGGGLSETLVLIELLNNNCDELIATRNIQSGGLVTFFEVKCKKRIMPFTFGMWHLPSRTYDLDANGNISGQINRFDREQDHKYLKFGIEFAEKIGMTPNEIKKIKKGEDVFLTTERLEKIVATIPSSNT